MYIDDIICHSANFDSHLQHLERIFECLEQAGLKVKANKYEFAMHKIEFLGHMLNENALLSQNEKIKKILRVKKLNNRKELQSYLGLVSEIHKKLCFDSGVNL